ncbi:DNA repair and recombination protein RAD54B-like [Arctopsyche grandis]|uniref:DNA repair and recombination protein RAD54B-like n=1 Tax=Arctopsyche grandis TaxID=121162 RepID=UPI00406DA493
MNWAYTQPMKKPIRTIEEVLNMMAKVEDSTTGPTPSPEIVELKNNVAVSSVPILIPNDIGGATYQVLWAKPSGRKKKIWEGDGQLRIKDNLAVLYGEDEKIISSTSAPSPHLLFSGSVFMLGSKEIEILEMIKDVKPIEEKNANCRPINKNKKFKPNTVYSNSPANGFNKPFNDEQMAPLVLPPPPNDHQWKFNTDKKPITTVSVDTFLTLRLRPHQREGVVFLYECIMGFKHPHTGAILADEMGLGKTLQCIALIWTLLKHGPYGIPVVRRALIIAPSTLCSLWNKEFLKWLGSQRILPYVVDNTNKPNGFVKRCDNVMIISYERLVKHTSDIAKINFDLIICDEAHRLKNSNIKSAQLLQSMTCSKRILLTGTPVQNDLQEFFVLSDIANPGIFGTYAEFKETFEDPILRSQKPDCCDEMRCTGEEKAKHLSFVTSSFILRRTQNIMKGILPSKTEYVVCCRLLTAQQQIYSSVLKEWWNARESLQTISAFSAIILMKKICNHPTLLKVNTDKDGDFSNYKSLDLFKTLPCNFRKEYSSKIIVLVAFFKQIVLKRNEKVVVISSSTKVLDIIAAECKHLDISHLRLDGNTPVQQRQGIVDNFNSNPNVRNMHSKVPCIFLLSSRAGGAGLSLSSASRLILFDSDWNPAIDNQAMARIWRDGQKKPVHIYRFLTTGTIEEKIYQRQMFKTGLSDAVMDSNNIKSTLKLSDNELKDLFSLSLDTESTTHDMLNCSCNGDGFCDDAVDFDCIENEENENFNLNDRPKEDNVKSINQLKLWGHLKAPFDEQFLEESGLGEVANNLSFVFRKVYKKL